MNCVIERGEIKPYTIVVGFDSQRHFRRFADPARQHDFGVAHTTLHFAGTVSKHRQCVARGKHLRLSATAGAICAVSGLDLQFRLLTVLGDHSHHRFGVITLQPRQRRIALYCGGGLRFLSQCFFRREVQAFGAQLTLVGTGDHLHHADAAHGHEIPGQAVAIAPVKRQIIDCELDHRIGQLPSGNRAVAQRSDSVIVSR